MGVGHSIEEVEGGMNVQTAWTLKNTFPCRMLPFYLFDL